MQPRNNVAQLNLATSYPHLPNPTPLVYNENDMDDETILIINCSHQFADSTSDIEILTYGASMKIQREAVATPILLRPT